MNQTRSAEFLYLFANMTNAEAYVEVFHNRLMRPLPDTDKTGENWGSTSRADFYPFLRQALSDLSSRPIRILDVGAGSGEMVDHVLKDYSAQLSIVEPNPLMMVSYLEAINRHPKLKTQAVCSRLVQNLYAINTNEQWLKNLPKQDFILASHMIYGLTNNSMGTETHPDKDLGKTSLPTAHSVTLHRLMESRSISISVSCNTVSISSETRVRDSI